MRKFNDITFIDLFAGIGGFRIALESFGAKCVFSSEIDIYAKETYQANFGEEPCGDITKIKSEEIPAHDILCAGFPCQPFSISGKQKGFEDTRGTLFFEIARITEYHKPKVLILENVRNLVRHNNGKTFSYMLRALSELGYNVFYKVLNAGDYGVPQSRERVYIICFRKDLQIKDFAFPNPIANKVYLKDILLPDKDTDKYVIVRNDIVIFNKYVKECKPLPIRIGTINKGGQGERIYSPLGHAITLSAYGGGAGAKTGAYLVNGRVRKLAPRECALVQGFPDEFIIPVSDNQAYKQFGNSVAVPVLLAILNEIVQLDEMQDYTKPVDVDNDIANWLIDRKLANTTQGLSANDSHKHQLSLFELKETGS